jgi:putative ABC transport system permease protein
MAGVVLALALSRVLKSFLFDVEPADSLTLIAVGLLFVLVALAACWAPGRRASRVDLMEALRTE